jgi:hypothetical protein
MVDQMDDPSGARSQNNQDLKKESAYEKLPRGLSEEDLKNPGVQKLILSDLDSFEEENKILKKFQDKFHQLDKVNAVLEEKLKKTQRSEIFYSFCIAFGGVLIGFSKSIWDKDKSLAILSLVFGGVLFIGGLVFKNFFKI